MVTVNQVFDTAIHLMDEQNESSGSTRTQDTDEYRFRTINILNSVIPFLWQYSSENYGHSRDGVILLNVNDYRDPDFDQFVPLDDAMCISVLPFYLAAQLLSGENEALASWFYQRYSEHFADFRRTQKSEFRKIDTPYGLF